MNKIYAMWILNDTLNDGFFDSWEEYFNFVWNPEITILLVEEV